MTLTEKFLSILSNILNNKKKSIKILNYIDKMESKGYINNDISLFTIKIIIIVLSYYPRKSKFVFKFIKMLYKTNNEIKMDFFNSINKFNLDYFDNNMIDDYYMDKIIFDTFHFIYNCYKLNKELTLTLFNEVLINTNKIKTNDKLLKIRIYLLYVKNSNRIILDCLKKDKINGQVYLKVVEICGLTTREINNFLNKNQK